MKFQSTPSRRGRQNPSFSIHLRKCFNPLPHAEGDYHLFPKCYRLSRFNPLPHAEGDRIAKLCGYYNGVSIHSLTQRETWVIVCKHNTFTFQSTPSRRGRPRTDALTQPPPLFQSTPSRRGRHRLKWKRRDIHEVSIHSLTQRETLEDDFFILDGSVSIHSLTQRETHTISLQSKIIYVSIHSLTQRETYSNQSRSDHRQVSIHSLTQRETFF